MKDFANDSMDVPTALTSVRNDTRSDNEMSMTPDVGNTGVEEEDPESQLKLKRARLEDSTPENKVQKTND